MGYIDLRKRVDELVGDVMTMPDGGATADLVLETFREWLNAPGHLNRYGYELADLICRRPEVARGSPGDPRTT